MKSIDKYTRSLFILIVNLILISGLFSSCSTNKLGGYSTPLRQVASSETLSDIPATAGPAEFPQITVDKGELAEALKKALKKSSKGMPEADFTAATDRLRHYLMFLGLTARDFKKAEKATAVVSSDGVVTEVESSKKPRAVNTESAEESEGEEEDKTPSNLKAIQRLFIASTQFLDCQDLMDWECLEKTPKLKPRADFRIDSKEDLGKPVFAGDSLEMEVFFTQAWDGSPSGEVAKRFTEKLQTDVGRSLSIAMYGIDDIKGSMSGVYNAIVDHAKTPSVDVKAVIDVAGFEKGSPWIFNYVRPEEKSAQSEKWLFAPSESGLGLHTTFQYDGTPDFIHTMNEGIQTQDQSRVRIEWSTSHIMHNKYAILENQDGQKSVWSGTANISKNCMGLEANSNMAVYIKNDLISQAFLDQFNLMFNFDSKLPVKSKLVINSDDSSPAKVGRFHRNKFPVSKRFFKFGDGTNLRVHFAPTDDAEHRVILPMLLSARAGDEIRISMFGGTGYEIIRAMQYAVAKGANVRIVFDARLGRGLTSWTRDSILNVSMPNPYIGKVGLPSGVQPGAITVRTSNWKGKNHYKVGSLSRKLLNGKMRAEQIIIGSQNWSSGGNDYNDENLISIQNLSSDVESAKAFNHEFDNRLWIKSRPARAVVIPAQI